MIKESQPTRVLPAVSTVGQERGRVLKRRCLRIKDMVSNLEWERDGRSY